jgi:DNA-binding response OmpR family regulator
LKALVVDDDRVLADLLAFTLRKEGFQVVQAFDGQSALDLWVDEEPDIILLDVNLPKTMPALDGFTICARIREVSEIPIILLTVRDEEEDVIHGLNMGADDYVLKPFSPRQLVARVQAVLRRVGKTNTPSIYEFEGLIFDPGKREAILPGDLKVHLTQLESRLLDYLCLRESQYVPFEDLIAHVWGHRLATRDMLRQLVRRLRSKIEQDPSQPVKIDNRPGLGYGLIHNPDI